MSKGTSAHQKKKYEIYKLSQKKERNKIKRIVKHLKKHGNDMKSVERMNELQSKLK